MVWPQPAAQITSTSSQDRDGQVRVVCRDQRRESATSSSIHLPTLHPLRSRVYAEVYMSVRTQCLRWEAGPKLRKGQRRGVSWA